MEGIIITKNTLIKLEKRFLRFKFCKLFKLNSKKRNMNMKWQNAEGNAEDRDEHPFK